MEPKVQYTQTKDGLSIAYSEMGEGEPLILMPNPPITNLEMEVQIDGYAYLYRRLAENFRLIRYDSRGSGLSDRSLENYSIDGFLLDLEAVVDGLKIDSFPLYAASNSTPTAITYAARNPERVRKLVVSNGWVRDSDWTAAPELKSLRGMFDKDWKTYTETFARVAMGWESAQAPKFAAMIRESTTADTIREWTVRARRMDASDLLGDVQCPTLVLTNRDFAMLEPGTARRIASGIPAAQLVVLDGEDHIFRGSPDQMLGVVEEFLGISAKTGSSGERGRFQTILFTDVEGSTALTERLGDAKGRELLREHESITRDALKEHGGSEVKTMGDGFMASFSSATGALECAVALQRAFEARNRSHETRDTEIKVRIGLNAGEPIAEDDPSGRGDLFGTAVNMAARIASKAEGGEILASNVVRELVAGKGFLFNDRGETELRGFEDPVRVYEVRWGDSG